MIHRWRRQGYRLLCVCLLLCLGIFVTAGCSRIPIGVKKIKVDGKTFRYYERICGEGVSKEDDLPILIALHGYGDHASNFKRLFSDCDVPLRVILPVAFDRIETSWYDPETGKQSIPASGEALQKFGAAIVKKYGRTKRVSLFGFSQGGIMATYLAAWYPREYSSAVIAGAALGNNYFPKNLAMRKPYPWIVQYHGAKDMVVMLDDARASCGQLSRMNYKTEFIVFNANHQCFEPDKYDDLFQKIRTLVALQGDA